jgi:hypothetical protein
MKINWIDIDEPYLHGVQATIGRFTCEVIREYASEWIIFPRLDGRIIQSSENKVTYSTKDAAKKAAASWLMSQQLGSVPTTV